MLARTSRGVALSVDNVISGSLTKTNARTCPEEQGDPDTTHLVCSLASCSGKIKDNKQSSHMLTHTT